MKKITTTLFVLGMTLITNAQVGINTTNPQGVFNIDGAKDNPVSGIPDATAGANDVVITSDGKVGIGTISPSNTLEINSGVNGVSGLTFSKLNSSTTAVIAQPIGVDANGKIVTAITGQSLLNFLASDISTNNIQPAYVDFLTLNNVPVGRWEVKIFMAYDADDDDDFAIKINTTGTMSGVGIVFGGNPATDTGDQLISQNNDFHMYDLFIHTYVVTGASDNAPGIAIIYGTINVTASGNITLRFARNEDGTIFEEDAARIRSGSYIKLTR